jgi:hypothetical protein
MGPAPEAKPPPANSLFENCCQERQKYRQEWINVALYQTHD